MIDLSEESLHENIEICSKYLARMAKMDMTWKSNWAAPAVKKTAWTTATWTLLPCTPSRKTLITRTPS
jgi:fructose-bisphosphate aldolase class II